MIVQIRVSFSEFQIIKFVKQMYDIKKVKKSLFLSNTVQRLLFLWLMIIAVVNREGEKERKKEIFSTFKPAF